jgi:hypothetical protein
MLSEMGKIRYVMEDAHLLKVITHRNCKEENLGCKIRQEEEVASRQTHVAV